jgi:hypothetical protein
LQNQRSVRFALCLLLLACLAACTHVPLTSLWKLRQFSFESFDPSALRLAVRLPRAYAVPREGLRVDAKVTREGQPDSAEQFALHESTDERDARGLPAIDSPEARWVVLRFPASEVERLRAFRERLMALKRDGGAKGKGGMHIGVAPKLCRTGAPVRDDSIVAGAILWAPDKGYVPLLRETALDDLLRDMDESRPLASLPSC